MGYICGGGSAGRAKPSARKVEGAPRNPALRNHFFVDWQTIGLPLHRWTLDKQSSH